MTCSGAQSDRCCHRWSKGQRAFLPVLRWCEHEVRVRDGHLSPDGDFTAQELAQGSAFDAVVAHGVYERLGVPHCRASDRWCAVPAVLQQGFVLEQPAEFAGERRTVWLHGGEQFDSSPVVLVVGTLPEDRPGRSRRWRQSLR